MENWRWDYYWNRRWHAGGASVYKREEKGRKFELTTRIKMLNKFNRITFFNDFVCA